jgi:ABC-2 type transport system permease protein
MSENSNKHASSLWVVASRELKDLWIGGRAPILLLLFSIVLSVLSFLLATNHDLNLTPPKEMVMLVLKATIFIGLFMTMIISADSISGEREKGSLEALLLTPVSRRKIILGKFIAAISPWPAVLAVSSIYMAILAPDSQLFIQALLWGSLLGTLLVFAAAAFGMLVSMRSASNRSSLSLSLVVFLFVLLPSQLPGFAQSGSLGRLIKGIDPPESTLHFLEKIIVNNNSFHNIAHFLISPILLPAILLFLLFGIYGPKLKLFAKGDA